MINSENNYVASTPHQSSPTLLRRRLSISLLTAVALLTLVLASLSQMAFTGPVPQEIVTSGSVAASTNDADVSPASSDTFLSPHGSNEQTGISHTANELSYLPSKGGLTTPIA